MRSWSCTMLIVPVRNILADAAMHLGTPPQICSLLEGCLLVNVSAKKPIWDLRRHISKKLEKQTTQNRLEMHCQMPVRRTCW